MATARPNQPASAPSAAIIVWLAMLVVGLGALTMLGYHRLLTSHGIGRLHMVRAAAPGGILHATPGTSGDMAREQAALLAEARGTAVRNR